MRVRVYVACVVCGSGVRGVGCMCASGLVRISGWVLTQFLLSDHANSSHYLALSKPFIPALASHTYIRMFCAGLVFWDASPGSWLICCFNAEYRWAFLRVESIRVVWSVSPAWEAVELTLGDRIYLPDRVLDPTD